MCSIDPRGITRTVTASEWLPSGSKVTFDCGHETFYAPHFTAPPVGEQRFCFKCGDEARKKLAT